MLCVLYINLIALCLGVIASCVERVLPVGMARRWVWIAVIAASVILPPVYRFRHRSVVALAGESLVTTHAEHVMSVPFVGNGWAAGVRPAEVLLNPVWFLLSALLLMWGFGHALRVHLAIRKSRESRLVDGVPVVVTQGVGPATVGLVHTRVLLPAWVLGLPSPEREYVVRHEDEHRRANDARLLFASSLSLVVLPWCLPLWWQVRRLHLAIELDCDDRVVSSLGNPRAYGRLLLKVAEKSGGGPRLQPAFVGGMGMLERRLNALVNCAPLERTQRVLLPLLAMVLLYVVLSMPHPVLAGEVALDGVTTHPHVRLQ